MDRKQMQQLIIGIGAVTYHVKSAPLSKSFNPNRKFTAPPSWTVTKRRSATSGSSRPDFFEAAENIRNRFRGGLRCCGLFAVWVL